MHFMSHRHSHAWQPCAVWAMATVAGQNGHEEFPPTPPPPTSPSASASVAIAAAQTASKFDMRTIEWRTRRARTATASPGPDGSIFGAQQDAFKQLHTFHSYIRIWVLSTKIAGSCIRPRGGTRNFPIILKCSTDCELFRSGGIKFRCKVSHDRDGGGRRSRTMRQIMKKESGALNRRSLSLPVDIES